MTAPCTPYLATTLTAGALSMATRRRRSATARRRSRTLAADTASLEPHLAEEDDEARGSRQRSWDVTERAQKRRARSRSSTPGSSRTAAANSSRA